MKPRILFYLLLGLLTFSLIGGGGAFYFTNQILQKNGEKFTAKQIELSNTSNQLAYLQRLQHDTDALTAQLGDLTVIYPKEKQHSQVIDQLLKLAANRNISLDQKRITFPPTTGLPSTSSQLTESPVVTGLYGMEVALSITGSFEDTIAFMQDIENFRRIMNISSINMVPVNENVSTLLTIEILVQQTAAASPDATAKGTNPPSSSNSTTPNQSDQGAAQ